LSIGRRAYDLLRGYVNTEWERIQDVEWRLAEKELRIPPPAPKPAPQEVPSQPEMAAQPPEDRRERACRILGLEQNCSFDDIRKCFTRLNKRSDPANFPDNSAEQVKAIEIHRKVNWAYAVLTEDMDRTERRFRTLELE